LKITEVAKTFGLLLSTEKYILFLHKIGCAVFWAIFSPTHPVALFAKKASLKRRLDSESF
jgi:hypothetical protein